MSLKRHAIRYASTKPLVRHLNAFNAEVDEPLSNNKDTLNQIEVNRSIDLNGRLIAVKDNFSTCGLPTTCSSAILHGYHSPFEADVLKNIRHGKASISGKTNMDEFGMGSHSTNTFFGEVKNAYSAALSAGGSSGGSAVAVAREQCFAALGTDTGGSIRLPAAYNDIVGFKPTYGRLSRWGVIAYANSLDTVGILARKVDDAQTIFEMLQAPGQLDPTLIRQSTMSRMAPSIEDNERPTRSARELHFGVPSEYNTEELTPIVRKTWASTLKSLQEQGHVIHPISLPTTRAALAAYYVLAPAEAASNLAKYDGSRYGSHLGSAATTPRDVGQVLYSSTRGQRLGEEVRRRILLGSYSLSAGAVNNYFVQAQKIRRLVQADFDNVFMTMNPLVRRHTHHESSSNPLLEHSNATAPRSMPGEIDFIIAPTSQTLPPSLSDVHGDDYMEAYGMDCLTVPPSLAGLPTVSVPVALPEEGESPKSLVGTVGMQIIGQVGEDLKVLQAAKILESFSSRPRRL